MVAPGLLTRHSRLATNDPDVLQYLHHAQLSFVGVCVLQMVSVKEHSMPKTQQDFLAEARRDIPEVSVEEVEARRKRGDDFVLLDVREKDEVRTGYIDGAVT